MPGDFPQIAIYLLAALIIVVAYFRLRRTFGRQRLNPIRMGLRITLFAIIGCLLLPNALRSTAFAGAALGGLLVGILLALWGASRTRFERDGTLLYYVPHTYTGIAVSLLLIGRVAFRLLQAQQMSAGVGTNSPAGPPSLSSSMSSPLTLGLVFVMVGYYVCYLGLILGKSKHLKADEAVEITSPLGAARTDAGRTDPGAPA